MLRITCLLLVLLFPAPGALAEVTLPSVFSDHMVLQRDKEVRVWGKAQPGEAVVVAFAGAQQETKANDQGDWQIELPARPASADGQTLTIRGKNTIEIKDVLVGEVWLASGQSNMAWTVAASANAQEEINSSANDAIRMWTAQRVVSFEPAFDVPGAWHVASPQTTGNFSAVAYFFARKLHEELGVPVGVVHSSWGGTPIEAWTSRDKLAQIDWAQPILKRFDVAVQNYPKAKAQFERELKQWQENRAGPKNTGEGKGYAKPGFDVSKWQTMKLPQSWEAAGVDKDGVGWHRRTIDLPAGFKGQALKLSLGPIDDGDITYVNGEKIGSIPGFNGGDWRRERVYDVPAKLTDTDKLTLAVRVVDFSGGGGFWGQPEQLTLARADGQGEPMSLAGEWKFHLEHELNARNRVGRRPGLPFGPEHPHSPAGLYNGMIAPIVPYTIRGAIWYQGESNASRAQQYRKLFPGMIEDWRQRWGQGDFPFLFVQLANYRQPSDKVEDTDWAHLRHAQLRTLRTVPNTGMAVTIDIGDANDIHPRNKQDVGKRLARWALADTYGKDVVKSGPIFQNEQAAKIDGHNAIAIEFTSIGSGLRAQGGDPLRGFTIAGKDGKFVIAKAELLHQADHATSKVMVWSDQVKDPVAVRYAWEDNPTEANLVNEEGLPASPFRTDDFKGPTDGRR